jgi:hypothetical protein
MIFRSKDKRISIEIRQQDRWDIGWALFIDGKYKKTKIIPRKNTAVVKSFGYNISDFDFIGV